MKGHFILQQIKLTFNSDNVLEKRNEKTNTEMLNKPKCCIKEMPRQISQPITVNKRYTKGVAYIVMCYA